MKPLMQDRASGISVVRDDKAQGGHPIYLDDVKIGNVLYSTDFDGAYISNIELAPEYRRRGYGRIIVKIIEREARKNGAPEIKLYEVYPEAEEFWFEMGYDRSDDSELVWVQRF